MGSIFSKAEEIKNEQKRAAICIVVDTQGSTPRKQGSKMIVYADGSIFGSIGGGSVEKEVIHKAVELIASGQPVKCTFNLEKDLAMHCGGTMEVYIEPINPSQKLYIFGAGHIGKAVALFARELDFSVTVFDPRENIFQDPVFTGCTCINKDYFSSIEEASFDENIYCVIVTPKHLYDEDVLAKLSKKPHAYIGMIGSSRKIELLKKRFLEEKIMSREELEKIDMPIGIRFRANTPQEIAISILAKLIDVRNSLINSNS
ncbi:MAG TPA: XdhC/CoxI family protein [Bacteroidales bacterium]|nr:XdhC/CoxI family protein [Bacteroidales bacterium]